MKANLTDRKLKNLKRLTASSNQSYEKKDRIRDNSLSPASPLQILLDTSFLLTMLKQHRDLEEEIRSSIPGPIKISTLDTVVYELERLARTRSSRQGALAKAGLELIKKRKYPTLESKPGPSDVDTTLIAFALIENEPTAIATVDRELREALTAQRIPTIYPRARSGLVFLGPRS